MNLKKAIAIALAAATVGCSCIFAASAADGTTYSKSINAKSGQVVTAKVYAQVNNPEYELISGIETVTRFDPTALSYTSAIESGVIETDVTTGSVMFNPHPVVDGDGNFLFSLMNYGVGTDLTSKTLLAGVEFDVNTTGVTTIESEILEAYANTDEVNDLLQDGTITMEILINGYALGDVDQNTKISVADAILVQKQIANITALDELQESLADVNGDGKISVADAIMIQKKIANIVDVL